MGSKLTPQQRFEKADRLILRAAVIKECAEEFQAQVTAMHNKADALQEAAFDMQRRGVEDRKTLDHALVKILQNYRSVLPEFKEVKSQVLSQISLAVEEGRASTEQVERFGLELYEFAKSHYYGREPAAVKHKQNSGEDLRDTLLASSNMKPVGPVLKEPEINAEASQISTSDLNDIASETSRSEDEYFSARDLSVPSIPEYANPASDHDEHIEPEPLLRKRKLVDHVPKAEECLNEDEELPVKARKKKQRRIRSRRNRRESSNTTNDEVIMPAADLDFLEENKRHKVKKSKRSRRVSLCY